MRQKADFDEFVGPLVKDGWTVAITGPIFDVGWSAFDVQPCRHARHATLLKNHPLILAKCAVTERLRRTPGVELHPTLYQTPFLYGPETARESLVSSYRGYLDATRRSNLPRLLSAPTWRLDAFRVADAGVPATLRA